MNLGIEGVSVLVNDVERWRGYMDEELYWGDGEFVWKRKRKDEVDGPHEKEFFRFAWMKGTDSGRYGKVGVWDERGRWWRPPEETGK